MTLENDKIIKILVSHFNSYFFSKFNMWSTYVIMWFCNICRQVWQGKAYLELHAGQLVHDLTESLSDDIPCDLMKVKWEQWRMETDKPRQAAHTQVIVLHLGKSSELFMPIILWTMLN